MSLASIINSFDQWSLEKYGPGTGLVLYRGVAYWNGDIDEATDEPSRLFDSREKAQAWCDEYQWNSYQLQCGGCETSVQEEKVY